MTEGRHVARVGGASFGAGQSLWQACIEQLAQEMPEQQFNTWIKPLTAVVLDDLSKVTVFVGNRFKLDWIRAQYSARIAGMLEKIYGQSISLELALAPRELSIKSVYVQSGSEQSHGHAAARRAWIPRPERPNHQRAYESDGRG